MEDIALPDFTGKVVILYLRSAPRPIQDGVVLEFPKFEMRNGRLFLAGRIPGSKGEEWIANCLTAVSWDDVIQYVEYRSMDDFKKKMSETKSTIRQKIGM